MTDDAARAFVKGGHVLVSGGSGGIGAAVCDLLGEEGMVPIVGFNRSSTAAEQVAQRTNGVPLHLDLESDASIDSAIAALGDPGIRLVGVVLAASPPLKLVPFGRITAEEMTSQLRVNAIGPQRLLAGVIRQSFRAHRQGCVVGVLTRAMGESGGGATPNLGAYVIAKFGMAGLLAVLAASHPWLRVGWVKPGFVDTPMLESFDERFIATIREKDMLGTPQVVARSIVDHVLGRGAVDGFLI